MIYPRYLKLTNDKKINRQILHHINKGYSDMLDYYLKEDTFATPEEESIYDYLYTEEVFPLDSYLNIKQEFLRMKRIVDSRKYYVLGVIDAYVFSGLIHYYCENHHKQYDMKIAERYNEDNETYYANYNVLSKNIRDDVITLFKQYKMKTMEPEEMDEEIEFYIEPYIRCIEDLYGTGWLYDLEYPEFIDSVGYMCKEELEELLKNTPKTTSNGLEILQEKGYL